MAFVLCPLLKWDDQIKMKFRPLLTIARSMKGILIHVLTFTGRLCLALFQRVAIEVQCVICAHLEGGSSSNCEKMLQKSVNWQSNPG